MAKRVGIKPSIRWSVMARDGFLCRYCGAQAGMEGVDLVVDHVLSVAEGGDNRVDNLVTACRTCNSGKAARSLMNAPASAEVVGRAEEQARTLEALSYAIRRATEARAELLQDVIDMKCNAYGVSKVPLSRGEEAAVVNLICEFGAHKIVEWYEACSRAVPARDALKYMYGCARKYREGQQ